MYYKIIPIFLFLLVSCDSNIEFIQYNSVNGVWNKDSIQNFNIELYSKQSYSYNSFVNIRINEKYSFNNIFLIVALRDSL